MYNIKLLKEEKELEYNRSIIQTECGRYEGIFY
jgi:hypothetical protein